MPDQTIWVALLTTSFPVKTGSVSGIFVQRLVKSLPASVHTTVITPCDTSPAIPSDDYNLHCFRYAPWKYQLLAHQPGGIPVALKYSKSMRWVLPIFLGAMFIAGFRVSRKADVIHANWSVNGAIAGLIGFMLRKPVITTLRGEDVTRAKTSKLYRYLLAWCMYSNKQLVTVSMAIYDLLSQEFPHYRHKIIFLPNGVDSELLNAPIAVARKKEKDIFNLLTIGSLIQRKGIDTIITALSYLHSPQDFKLSIIGDGVEMNDLKKLVKTRSLDGMVEFVGQVPPDKVVEFLYHADAFILASHSEGRPNVILESFAAGVPVIASDIEGVQELVQDNDNGMRFQPGNAKELSVKIKKLQQNKKPQIQFANRGREFILKNHLLWRHVGEQYTRLYRETIQNKDL